MTGRWMIAVVLAIPLMVTNAAAGSLPNGQPGLPPIHSWSRVTR
jgi:hypothetical protein